MSDPSNYNTCLYCGRVNGYADASMPAYCNLGCQAKSIAGQSVGREAWRHNFEVSLVEFNQRRERWRAAHLKNLRKRNTRAADREGGE